MSDAHRFKVRADEVDIDSSLSPDHGWVDLRVRWLISRASHGATRTVVGYSVFPPGARHDLHHHPNAEEWEHVLRGHGIKRVGGDDIAIGPGDTIFTPAGTYHGVANVSEQDELVTIWGYCGAASLEEAGYVVPADDGEAPGAPWPPRRLS